MNSDKEQQRPQHFVEIDLLDYLSVLFEKRWLLIRNLLIGCVVAALISIVLPRKYTSVATILPPGDSQRWDFQNSLSELSISPFLMPSISSTSDLFVEILQSRTVGEAVLKRTYSCKEKKQTLLKIYKSKSIEQSLSLLKRSTTTVASEQGIITIKVEMPARQLAADVANAYVEELDRVNKEKNISQAKNSRLYIEEQLQQTGDKLKEASQNLADFQETNKAISIEEQTKTTIEYAGELKGQILAKQIELGTLRMTMKEDNPRIIMVEREIEEMQTRYNEIQYGKDESLQDQKEFYIPIAELPEVGRQLAELIREVKVQETVWELLNQQYYQAKIQEARDTPTVQQLDYAETPEYRSSPKRKLIVIVGGLLGLVFSVFWIFGAEYMRQIRSRENDRAKVDTLWRYVQDDVAKAKELWGRIRKKGAK